jgi:phosphate transport system permease protein
MVGYPDRGETLIEKAYTGLQNASALQAKRHLLWDKIIKRIFLGMALLSGSIILIVIIFILYKGLLPFFKTYTVNGQSGSADFGYFLTGLRFNAGYDTETGRFLYGVGFLIVNTLLLNLFVAVLAIPCSILTALFIAKIAPKILARILQSGIELLAAIPSVIFGIFGIGVIIPIIKSIANGIGIVSANGISLISGAIILSMMALPTIVTISLTALNAVDENQMKGSLALGASPIQTDFKIALRGAKSGIFAGIILGIGRSLGEATAVSMVCGSPIYGITLNPFLPTVTLSSQMLLSIGEAVPGSLNYDARFSAGIMLLLIILLNNAVLNDIKSHFTDINKRPLAIVRAFHALQRGVQFLVFYTRGLFHGNRA